MKAIVNGRIIVPNKVLENKVLVIRDGKIIDITDNPIDSAEIIDAKGLIVAPGFVDVHIHGSMGADVMDGTVDAIKVIASGIAQYGTTSFLPTTLTMAREDVYKSLEVVRSLQGEAISGAEVLGAHLEGPFINVNYKGAQNEKFVISPDYEWVRDFSDVIKLITYAPEMDPDFAFTKKVKAETDVILSIGHSEASYELVNEATRCGCSHVTHLFNGMRGLHHREPGIIGAVLMNNDVFTELIADKIHVNEHLFQFVLNNKGAERIVLITDSIRAGCMKDGIYDIGGQDANVLDGTARLADGTLAGSVLTLNKAVRNFYENTDATLPEVIHMASLNPATSINVADHKGSLEVGKDADVILLDDEFNCYLALVNGKIVTEKDEWRQGDEARKYNESR